MPLTRDIALVVNDSDIWLIDNTSTTNVEYWGYAAPGTTTSSSNWKVIKLTKDASGLMISKLFANGTPSYTNTYDNRTTYTYS